MAGIVGSIAIKIGANSAQLVKGLDQASKKVAGFSAKTTPKLKAVSMNIAKMGAAAAAAAGTGLFAITKSASTAGKELKNFSQIARTSVSEFQAMAIAADQFGISQEKLAGQLKDVSERVGDFLRDGGGPMAAFFENIAPKVGVTAEMFKELSGKDALLLYVDSLEKAGVSQNEMTVYLEDMASDLTSLEPLLANNAALLKKSTEEAKAMGLILSDMQVENMAAGAKAFDEMAQRATQVKNVIGAQLSPIIVNLNEQFKAFTKNINFNKAVGDAVDKSAKAIGFLSNVVRGLHLTFKGIEIVGRGAFSVLVTAVEIFAKAWRGLINTMIKGLNKIIDGLNKVKFVGEELAHFDPFTGGAFMEGLERVGSTSRQSVAETIDAFGELALMPMPADTVTDFINKFTTMPETIKTGIQSTKAVVNEETMGLVSIVKGGADSIQSIWEQKFKDDKAGMAQNAKATLGIMADHSKKAFKINKAWALTDATISMAQGIAAGVRLGWPAAIPAVAYATVNGLAQINSIKNQRFNGGSSGAPSAAAPAVAAGGGSAAALGSGGGGGGSGQTITVAPFDPQSLYEGSNINNMMNQVADFIDDGGRAVFQQ